jgi:rsbT co-antagonist protein RsbR
VTGGAVLVAQTIAAQLVPTTRTVSGIALLSFVTTVAVVAFFARSFHTALAAARAQATSAQAAQRETAAREAALAKIVVELEASHAHVQQLYDVVQDLETPTIPLVDGALVVPIVGRLDAQRTDRLQQSILQAVYRQRAHTLIMDLTGLVQPDAAVLQQLLQIAQSVQLLGTRLILTGIGAGVAQQMAEQQIKLPRVQTLRSLDEGVQAVLAAQTAEHTALRN